jgi:hypothetical protein
MARRAGLVTLLGVAVCSALAPQGRAARPPLNVQAVMTSQHPTPNGYTLHENLFRASTRVGTSSGACQDASSAAAQPTSASCRVTLKLAAGTLAISFKISFANDSGKLSVVGGTGAYSGARGHGTLAAGKIAIVFT